MAQSVGYARRVLARPFALLLLAAASAVSAAACRREPSIARPVAAESDAAPASTSSSAFRGKLPKLDVALGFEPVFVAATPGRYLGALTVSKTEYPTMEIYVRESRESRATLSLDEGGAADGCFASRWSYHSTRSQYATRSGKAEVTDDRRSAFIGARGRWWRGEDGWLEIELTASARDVCPLKTEVPRGSSLGPVRLRCVRIAANEILAEPVLACVAVGVEPWALRDGMLDLAQEEPRRWLLLGAAPGLQVKWTFEARERGPRLTIRPGPAALVPAAWVGDAGAP